MCHETTQLYHCACKIILTSICYEHIQHTAKQLDNNPCPFMRSDTTQSGHAGCADRERCWARVDQFWSFEKRGESLFERDERVRQQREMEKLRRENERLKAEKKLMWLSPDAEEEKKVKKVKFEEGLKQEVFEDEDSGIGMGGVFWIGMETEVKAEDQCEDRGVSWSNAAAKDSSDGEEMVD